MAAAFFLMAPLAVYPTDEPINITPSDFRIPREKLLEQVTSLESMGDISTATADYARLFNKLQEDLKKAKPPVTEWDQKDRDRVKSLTEPSDAAWQALRTEQAETQERLRQRAADAEQAQQIQLQSSRDENRRQLDINRAEQEARLREAQIRETEARTDYYEDSYDNAYPIYGSNWWFHPGKWKPRVPRPWENRYYGTKPMIPNNYEGRRIP